MRNTEPNPTADDVADRAYSVLELARVKGPISKSTVDELVLQVRSLGSVPLPHLAGAVYGVLAWLTTREKSVTIGARNDCAVVAELAQEFCDERGLGEPLDNWDGLVGPNPSDKVKFSTVASVGVSEPVADLPGSSETHHEDCDTRELGLWAGPSTIACNCGLEPQQEPDSCPRTGQVYGDEI